MTAKLTRLTHKIAIQLQLMAESYTIYSSLSRRPIRKLFDTPSYYASSRNILNFVVLKNKQIILRNAIYIDKYQPPPSNKMARNNILFPFLSYIHTGLTISATPKKDLVCTTDCQLHCMEHEQS